MHTGLENLDAITTEIIGAAIEVHRTLGPGLLESVYRSCLVIELRLRSLKKEGERCSSSTRGTIRQLGSCWT
jgi:hypothetical protein